MEKLKKVSAKFNSGILEISLIVISIFLSIFLMSYSETKAQSIPQIPSQLLDSFGDKIIKTEGPKTDIRRSILLKKIVPNTIKLLFYIGSAIAVMAIFYAGYTILTSFGDQKRYKEGWQIFGVTIAGVFIMLLSRGIIGIVENINISDKKVIGSDVGLDSSVDINKLPTGEFETELIPNIIGIAVELVALVIIVLMIYAGIMYVTSSAGADENRKKSKDIFLDSLTGLAILLTAYALVSGLLKINFGG